MISLAMVHVTCESCLIEKSITVGESCDPGTYDESQIVQELKDDGWVVMGDEEDIGSLTVFCSDECEEKYHNQ